MTTPQQRMTTAYDESNNGQQRRDERLAATHKHDDQLEEYAALYDSDRDRFDRLPRQMRMSVGHYMEARAAAKRTGLI